MGKDAIKRTVQRIRIKNKISPLIFLPFKDILARPGDPAIGLILCVDFKSLVRLFIAITVVEKTGVSQMITKHYHCDQGEIRGTSLFYTPKTPRDPRTPPRSPL